MKLDKAPENDPQNFDIIITGGPVWSYSLNAVQLDWFNSVKFNFEKSTFAVFVNGLKKKCNFI
jgi:hypothetical protein